MRLPAPRFVRRWILASSALIALTPAAAPAAPVLGFIEDFPGPGIGAWSGGTPVFNNPGSGGVLGAGDGYLYVQTTFASNWGIRCRVCPEYTGSWSAAGITEVRLWLNDVSTPEPFEVHVVIGNDHNLWQYDVGFAPPSGRWAPFVVDLSSAGDFTQIIGTQPFSEALDSVDVLLIRHDKAPYLMNPNPPDAIAGDAGIDRILLTNGTVGIPPAADAGRPLRLAAPYPNPARGAVMFRLENPQGGPVQLQILDVLGRLVRHEAWPAGGSGVQTWRWDRLGDDGGRVPPGMYRVRAQSAAGGMSRPFVLVD